MYGILNDCFQWQLKFNPPKVSDKFQNILVFDVLLRQPLLTRVWFMIFLLVFVRVAIVHVRICNRVLRTSSASINCHSVGCFVHFVRICIFQVASTTTSMYIRFERAHIPRYMTSRMKFYVEVNLIIFFILLFSK